MSIYYFDRRYIIYNNHRNNTQLQKLPLVLPDPENYYNIIMGTKWGKWG